MKYVRSTRIGTSVLNIIKIGKSVLNGVNRSFAIKTKSTFAYFDRQRENLSHPRTTGLAEYAIDNDMIDYQRRVYNNYK